MVALSPLLSMRPSRQQRKIAALREAAALGGLTVQLLKPPEQLPEKGLLAFYKRLRGREDPQLPGRILYSLRDGSWNSRQGKPELSQLELLERFPEGVIALVADAGGVGVFWDERGDAADVTALGELLRAWIGLQKR